MVDKVVQEKYYEKTDTEKVDLGDCTIFIQSLHFFLFFCISFFLLEVKCRIIKFDFSQNSCQLT